MKEKLSPWVDASEAIALLDISRPTLYAYVSRGRIRSEPLAGATRQRRYSRDDIERLIARTRERRNPEKAAEQALHWGMPVLESCITMIADGKIYFRGQDASALAGTASVAEVAALLWTQEAEGNTSIPTSTFLKVGRHPRQAVPFVAAAQIALAQSSTHDPLAYDLRAHAVARTGWRILWQLTNVASGIDKPLSTIDATLAAGWGILRSADRIRAALILSADHELNVSTFTARCVASAGSSPYAVVIAGLAALEGTKHGGTTARIETLWDGLRRTRDLKGALAERLRRGENIDGFGHPLYRNGDPRAAVLLDMLPVGKATTFARELGAAAKVVLDESPTIDFALVALARALNLPTGAALTLFAIGRTIGWIGHAIEQYEGKVMIRPRAKYVGKQPESELPGPDRESRYRESTSQRRA